MSLTPTLTVEGWPIDRLRLDIRNPRRHPPAQIESIRASIRAFGFVNPVLVDPDGAIIAGEARWLAARAEGFANLPAIVLSHLSPVERDALRIADNRLPEGASWDEAQLGELLRDLAAQPIDLAALGFDEAELGRLLDQLTGGDDEPTPAPAPPQGDPVSRLGDVWRLGDHRLICGDATDAATIARLLESDTAPAATAWADLVFTDPPYGMAYEGGRAQG